MLNASRHFRTLAALIVVLCSAATILYWWQLSNSISKLQEETLSHASLRARQLSSALADQTAILIRYIDFAAQELAIDYVAGDPAGFDAAVRRAGQRFPEKSLLQVVAIDANGYLAYSSLGFKEPMYLGDRDHFKAHLGGGNDLLYISAPLMGRVSNKWSIHFSRAIRRNGRFEGVVSLVLSPDYLHRTLQSLTLASDDSVSIVRGNGEYLARNLDHELALGKLVGQSWPFLEAGSPASGSFRSVAQFDQVPRLYQWQRLADYPIVVVIGLSESTLMKPAEEIIASDRRQAVLSTGLLWALAVGLLVLLRRMSRQQLRLADSEEHFRAVFDHAADAILVHDMNGRFVEVNRTACKSLGYAREELLGMTVMDIAPDTRPRNGVWEEVGAGRIVEVNSCHKRKDGSIFPVAIKLGAVALQGERRIIALVRDVTALREAERNLRESESRLQLALGAANDGLWDWDLAADRAYLAPRFYELVGHAPGEVAPDREFFKRLIHPDDRERVLAAMDEHLSGDAAELNSDCRMVSPAGEIRWVKFSGKVVERAADETPLRMVGTLSDITDRKLAEQQLRKLSRAVEQSPESIVITNTAAEVEYVNEAFTRTTGYSLAEMIGRNPRILHSGLTPPETYPAMWAALKEGRSWKGEFVNRRKDGTEYIEFAIVAPIREADGRVTHYVAVKEDVTEKKRLGKELDRHRHHLEELVEQRTAELAAARDAARAASRAKSEFLANMSHEIRTPLNGVLGLAQIGYRDESARPKTRDAFGRIMESGKLLLGVINDILDFSKIEAGKLQVEMVDTRPGEIIDHIVQISVERAHLRGLELHGEKAPDLPAVCLSDPLRLQQILLNLVANAIKFTESGRVTVRASRVAENLRFEVIDTGIGLSEDQIGRIFAPFEQADTSTTRRFGGTGLGLTITHRLVELMGGEITVDSKPGEGSTFAVTLPFVAGTLADEITTPQVAPETAGRRLAGLSILVVEDNVINQMVIEEMLSSEGAATALVGNGADAVDLVARQSADAFDLVLMDVQMPVMDGYEATRRILTFAPDLPIIGQTAHAMAEERHKCLASGMVDHIAKPIDQDDLVRRVLHLVGAKVPAARNAAPAGAIHSVPA